MSENFEAQFPLVVGKDKEHEAQWRCLTADIAESYYDKISAELAEGAVEDAARPGLESALLRQGQTRNAEGILHSPKEPNGTLVIFAPGMPGDSNVWFEKKHVPVLLEKGYTVFALRHLGTKQESGVRVNTEAGEVDKSSVYINCPERRNIPEQIGGGDEPQSLEEMALEIAVVINALGGDYKDIKIVNHSAGGVNTHYAIASGAIEAKHLSKISSIVNLSPYIGGDDDAYRTFTPDGYYEWAKQFVNMGDANTNVALVRRMFQTVYENRSAVPENTMVVSVVPQGDEYVTLKGADRFQEYFQRGLVIDDKTQSTKYGGEKHDLANLQPDTLLRLIKMQYPKSKHKISVVRGA